MEFGGIIRFKGVHPVARYYIEMESYRYGPFELQELKQLYLDGVLKSDQIYEEQSNQLFSLTRLLAESPAAANNQAEVESNAVVQTDAATQNNTTIVMSQPSPQPVGQAQSPASHGTGRVSSETSAIQEMEAVQSTYVTQNPYAAQGTSAMQGTFTAPETHASAGSAPSASESWSERLSRLKEARKAQMDEAVESPVFSEDSVLSAQDSDKQEAGSMASSVPDVAPDPLKSDFAVDSTTNELMEGMMSDLDYQPSATKSKDKLPDLLVANGPHPEELINYNTGLKGEPDLPNEQKDWGGKDASTADNASADSFPTSLGYMSDALDMEPPVEWLTNTAGSANKIDSTKAADSANEAGPVDAASSANEAMKVTEATEATGATGATGATEAAEVKEAKEANPPESPAAESPTQVSSSKERSADEALAWREQMARLDVVYGVRKPSAGKELQGIVPDDSESASAALGAVNSISENDEEDNDLEDEGQEKSESKLGALVFITAGLVALMAHKNYANLPEIPILTITVALCGYAALTAICGVMLWIDSKRFAPALRVVLLCLAFCPLAIIGYTLFIYKDTVMAMQIPKALQITLAYMAASLIMFVLGLASLKKATEKAENG